MQPLAVIVVLTALVIFALARAGGEFSMLAVLGVAIAGWFLVRCGAPHRTAPSITGGGGTISLVAKEYQAWLISRALLQVVCRTSNQGCRMVLEGWIINSVPESVDRFSGRGGAVWFALHRFSYLESELRRLGEPALVEPAKAVVQQAMKGLKTGVWDSPEFSDIDHEVEETADGYRYGAFRLNGNDHLRLLVKTGGLTATITMMLRYGSIMAGGHHWSVPAAAFDVLWGCGVRNEAFASPINSLVLGRPGVSSYYSRFLDVDAPFGSQGNWLNAPFASVRARTGGWEINPPFTKKLLAGASARAIELAAAGCDIFFITRFNTKSENPYEAVLTASVAAVVVRVPYETRTPRGVRLTSPTFDTHLIYAGPRSKEWAEKQLAEFARVWATLTPAATRRPRGD